MAADGLDIPPPAGPLSEPLLDPPAAAGLLSVKPSWVYEAVRDGRLPHLKVGRHIRFLRTDLEAWVIEQRAGR
jgi:excisionase family DNA binding protein